MHHGELQAENYTSKYTKIIIYHNDNMLAKQNLNIYF